MTKDVPDSAVVAGNPARRTGERARFEPAFISADWKRYGVARRGL